MDPLAEAVYRDLENAKHRKYDLLMDEACALHEQGKDEEADAKLAEAKAVARKPVSLYDYDDEGYDPR